MQIDAADAYSPPPRLGAKVILLLVGAALRCWPPIRPLRLMPTRSISIPNLREQARSWTSPKYCQAFPNNITDFADEACHAAASPSTFYPSASTLIQTSDKEPMESDEGKLSRNRRRAKFFKRDQPDAYAPMSDFAQGRDQTDSPCGKTCLENPQLS